MNLADITDDTDLSLASLLRLLEVGARTVRFDDCSKMDQDDTGRTFLPADAEQSTLWAFVVQCAGALDDEDANELVLMEVGDMIETGPIVVERTA
jgi:hypothetical protein